MARIKQVKAKVLGKSGSTRQDMNLNPTGKGGFKERPQDINRYGPPKNEQRFDFWLSFFKNLSRKELREYDKELPNRDPYGAEIIAYEHFKNSNKDLATFKEISARTEGQPRQHITVKDEFSDYTEEELEKLIKGEQKTKTRYKKK